MTVRTIIRFAALVCTCVVAAIAISACGSSDDGDTAATTDSPSTLESTQAANEEFSGEPIVIGTMSSLDSPIGSFPESYAGVKAAALAINEAGGIDGHELKVVTCNGKFEPNQEAACARKMVDEGVIAVAGAFPIANVDGFFAPLEKANIANVAFFGDFGPAYQYENGFPIDFMVGAHYGCLDGELAKTATGGDEARVMIGNSAPEQAAIPSYERAAANLGTEAQFITVPNTATDLSPVVAQAEQKGDGIVAMNVPPTQQVAILTAEAQAGHEWAQCLFDVISPDQRKELGSVLSNAFISGTFPPLGEASKYPLLGEFEAQLQALADSGNQEAEESGDSGVPAWALRAWLGVQVIDQVAESIKGPITRDSFMAAIEKAKVDLGGVVPTLDFAKPIHVSDEYPRVFNPTVVINKWDAESQEVVAAPELAPIDMAEALR